MAAHNPWLHKASDAGKSTSTKLVPIQRTPTRKLTCNNSCLYLDYSAGGRLSDSGFRENQESIAA